MKKKKSILKNNTCIIIKKNLDCKKINKVQHFKLAFDPNLKPLRITRITLTFAKPLLEEFSKQCSKSQVDNLCGQSTFYFA